MSAEAMDQEMAHAARKVEKVAGGHALGNALPALPPTGAERIHTTPAAQHQRHGRPPAQRPLRGRPPASFRFGSVVQVQGIGTFLAVDTARR